MLSEIEISYFRSRIDDVLREGQLTGWQRQFLQDMQEKLRRYGARTRFSEKQLATLKRLTKVTGDADLRTLDVGQKQRPLRRYPQRQPRQRASRRWRTRDVKLLVWLAVIVMAAASYVINVGISSSGGNPVEVAVRKASPYVQSFTVTDGDTVRMNDGTPVRLVGFNTPETFEPRCEMEARLGEKAKNRLRKLVASGIASVTKVPCACAPGTEGTKRCNFGRSCGILHVDGRDVGQTMISEGLAVPFRCGQTSCPPMQRPWCSQSG